MQISIVIPALNEEKYLPILLTSLVNQTLNGFEVVVVDYNSTDKTKDVVLSYQDKLDIKYLNSEFRGQSAQRNFGAKNAKFNALIFLDADNRLDPNFLELFIQKIQSKKADLAVPMVFVDSEDKVSSLLFYLANVYVHAMFYITPVAPGACVFVTKKLLFDCGGFDEKISNLEDYDFFRRAAKLSKRRPLFIKELGVHTSPRRLHTEGRFKASLKLVLLNFQFFLFGPIRKEGLIKREYGRF